VAYAEEDVRRVIAGAGLAIREPIVWGGWCGRARAREGQDMVVADKV
jgi:hypothetical protein